MTVKTVLHYTRFITIFLPITVIVHEYRKVFFKVKLIKNLVKSMNKEERGFKY